MDQTHSQIQLQLMADKLRWRHDVDVKQLCAPSCTYWSHRCSKQPENQSVCLLERRDSQISLMQPCCPFPGSQPFLLRQAERCRPFWSYPAPARRSFQSTRVAPGNHCGQQLFWWTPVQLGDLCSHWFGTPFLKESSNPITRLNCGGCMPAHHLLSTLGPNSILTITTVKQEKLNQR